MGLRVYPNPASGPAPQHAQTLKQRLHAAPHRGYFAAGLLSLLLLAQWWLLQLLQQQMGISFQRHALMTLQGVFPLFMAGFIYTAGPRWLQLDAAGPQARQPGLALIYLAGVLLQMYWPAQAWLGSVLMLLVWGWLSLGWLQCLRRSRNPDQLHACALLVAMLGGCLALALTACWQWDGRAVYWLWARELTLWCWLLPVFLIVCHRMLPFFTQTAIGRASWRPAWLLQLWLLACVLIACSNLFEWPRIGALVASLLAVLFGYTSVRWGILASLQNRLLAMLHLSFIWLALASVLLAMTFAGISTGSAARHALAFGFCCTMLVAFVTRVCLGHGAYPLQADAGYWYPYLALHLLALLRVSLALWGGPGWLLSLTSAAWLALMLAWAGRLFPVLLRPRRDSVTPGGRQSADFRA